MHFGGARRSLGVPWWCPDTSSGLPDGFRAHKECLEKFRKLCFLTPSRKMERFGGSSLSFSAKYTPSGSRLVRKV